VTNRANRSLSLQKAFDAWQFEAEARGRSPQTTTLRKHAFKRFCEACELDPETADIGTLSEDAIYRFYRWMRQDKKYGEVTLNTLSRTFRTFVGYCKKRGWIDLEPPAALHAPQQQRPVLTKEQMLHLFKVSEQGRNGPRNKALVTTLCATGLRLGEISRLELTDIDWHSGMVSVRPETSKSRRFRQVPLGAVAKQDLWEYVTFTRGSHPTMHLFLGEDGRPLQPRGIQMILKRLARKVGLKRLFPHMLRHTFATQSLLGGAQLPIVQAMMGHSSIRMTSVYINQAVVQESLRSRQWTPADLAQR
jgi:site-specific recombinase XerD